MMATQGDYAVMDAGQLLPGGIDDPEYKVPEVVIVWAQNTISCADGFYEHWVSDCAKRGSKLIVVDPRWTWCASRAEVFLQIRPGTDGALALGMLNVIISEGLYDKEFVEKWTYGFDELKARAAEYPLDPSIGHHLGTGGRYRQSSSDVRRREAGGHPLGLARGHVR